MNKTYVKLICLLTLLSGMFCQTSMAQPEGLSKSQYRKYVRISSQAKKRYDNFSYAKGIDTYKKALKAWPTNDTVKLEIAKGYYLTGALDSAEVWYDQVIESSAASSDDSHYLNYAEILTSNGEYQDALGWFEKYRQSHPDEDRVNDRIAGLNELLSFYGDSLRFEIRHEDFNSEGYDFSPTYYQDQLYFVSSRETSGLQFLKPKYDWDQTYFLNAFVVDSAGSANLFTKKLTTSYHEGPAVFYADDTKMIFTRNNVEKGHLRVEDKKLRVQGQRIEESKEGINKLKLFFTEMDDKGGWKIPKELHFNSDEYSTGHPTLSKDEQRLYFASDREGGLGETDIYVCQWRNGVWGEPENLGDKINTEGSEMFPYIDENDVLYFASNGHRGLGGLDIFKVDLKAKDLTPKNMGYPLNSSNDDFGMIVKEEGDYLHGYFSSNRAGGLGLDDIYEFKYLLRMNVPGQVIDIITGQPIANAQAGVSEESLDANVMGVINTDALGIFNYSYKLDDEYFVAATKKDYNRDTMTVRPIEYIGDTISLHIMKNLLISGVVSDKIKGDTLSAVKVLVTNEKTKKKFGLVTKEDGHYSFLADSNTKYSFEYRKHKFFTSRSSVDTGDRQSGVIIHDGEMEELFVGKPIVLDDIHYDLAKWNIRPDAAIELDEFHELLQENPSIIVELSAHTDCRSSDNYNMNLSDKRAKSAAQYLFGKGIPDKRLSGRGYGETKLLNECADGVSCSEDQHQANRRTEFMVTGFLPDQIPQDERDLLWIEPEYVAAGLAKESSVVLVSYGTKGSKIIKGAVEDETGRAVSGAMITLMVEGTNEALHVLSEDDGSFVVKVYPDKSYTLIIEKDGFIEEGEKFKGDEIEKVEFKLARAS